MNNNIDGFEQLDISNNDDELAIYDESEEKTKKIKKGNFYNNSYTLEETKTGGKWVDGKPIYRRCLPTEYADYGSTFYHNVDGWTDVLAGMNIDTLISADVVLTSPTPSTGGDFKIYVRRSDFYIRDRVSGDVLYPKGTLLLVEYTKTTD